jgi:undecaprenyl-diphosphatase
MAEWLEALILGIVQGITEFLPISSSGHLEIVKYLLGDDALASESLKMTIIVHAATALSTLVVYRKDVANIGLGAFNDAEHRNYIGKIIVSMLPAVMVGLLFESEIELLFDKNLIMVSFMLVITGLLLLFAHKSRFQTKSRKVSYSDAFFIGIAQAIAIMPGISRSGATISAALLLGGDKSGSARFSFLMVIPLILGKMAKEILDGDFSTEQTDHFSLLVAFTAAFITGLIACTLMIKIVRQSKLSYFAAYCFVVALILWFL